MDKRLHSGAKERMMREKGIKSRIRHTRDSEEETVRSRDPSLSVAGRTREPSLVR